MINIFVYFSVMFMMMILVMFMSLIMYYEDYGMIFEWMLLSFNSMNMEILIYIDWLSLLFIGFIFLISSMILLYSYEYMKKEKFIERFIYLLILFIFSMILMIISPSVISILFGWDGLGLVSYCLIIYYQNYSSYNSGMVTVLCNRIGDVGFLLCIALMMMKGSWNIWSLMNNKSILVMFMMFLAAITKSAQLPFSSWLPMAMAAPTPVSALVHSSTLVTAGVYLMIRFSKFLLKSGLENILFFLSVMTMFMAGMMAMFEYDLKKVIALSTLSQLGLMMMILSGGQEMLAFYHLLTHAIFKSMLFMCAGIIIHSMGNNQDMRLFGNLNEIMPFTMMSFLVSSLALCGFPFFAGFYSKDYIMETIYIYQVNGGMLLMIILSLMFTVIYSIRLFYYLFYSKILLKNSYYSFSENKLMNFSMMILIFFSMFMGSMLNWLFFFDYYHIFLKFEIKIFTIELCLLGSMMGMLISLCNFFKKYYYLGYFMGSMMFLNFLYSGVILPVIKIGVSIYEGDKSWFEFSMKNVTKILLDIINKSIFSYKIYMFLMILIMSLIILILLI